MENKRQKKLRAQVSEDSSESKKLSQEIPFELFFAKCVFEGKLKYWQRKEIFAFFKDMNLREKEDLTTYEETLGKF